MRPSFSSLLVGPALICLGCSPAKSAPPTTIPSSPHSIVKLTDCVPLDELQVSDRQANFTDKISPPLSTTDIYFGELDLFDDDSDQKPIDAVPIIATRPDGKWMAIPLVGEGLRKAGWRYVASGPNPREIWGALDTVTDDQRPSFVLAHSTDGGATFDLQVFRKPARQADFFDFAMDNHGRGRATVAVPSAVGPHKAGLYHYETTDDGKTWSNPPRLEPDAMLRADPVPDDEQPEAPTGQPRTSSTPGAPDVHPGLKAQKIIAAHKP